MKKICVIGAGITGMTTAYMLHEAGYHVTVITDDSTPGTDASRTNAMQLCYGTIAPYAGWGDIKKYARYMFHSTQSSAVYVNQPFSLDFMKFCLLSGLTAIDPFYTKTRYRLYELAQESRHKINAFTKQHPDLDFYYKQTGKLRIFEDDAGRAAEEKKITALNKKYNAGIEFLDSDEVYAREPSLKNKTQPIAWATYEPDNASASSWAMCQRLHEYLSQSNRYDFRGDALVKGFRKRRGIISNIILTGVMVPCDAVVISAGAGSPSLLKKLNVKIPMIPIQGYSFTLDYDPMNLNSCFSDLNQKFAMNSYDGNLRISGLMDFTGFGGKPIPERLEYLKKIILNTFPNLNLDGALARTGLRPVMAQSYPLMGRRKFENLYLNTGHGVYGWTLAFGSASRLLDQIKQSI